MHAKRDYYRKTFNQFSDNIRKTWQTINDTLNRKRRSKDCPQEFILSNGKIISDHKQIANEFNDFFINIGEPECQNKDATYTFSKYLPEKANTNLLFKAVTEEEIGNIINMVQLGPRYEGQLNPMAEPIPHEVRPLVRTHVYHPYHAADRQAETDS